MSDTDAQLHELLEQALAVDEQKLEEPKPEEPVTVDVQAPGPVEITAVVEPAEPKEKVEYYPGSAVNAKAC